MNLPLHLQVAYTRMCAAVGGSRWTCKTMTRPHKIVCNAAHQDTSILTLVTRACFSAEITFSVFALITVENCGQFLEVCVAFDHLQSHSLASDGVIDD